MASESFFDNTTFFHTAYGMLHFNPNPGNSLVLLFFNSSKLFPFRLLLGHAYFNAIRSVPDETCILPEPDAFGEQKRLLITNLFVMDMAFICGTQPHDSKIAGTQQVVLYAMSFFYRCSMPTACLRPQDAEWAFRFHPAVHPRIL